MSQYTDLNGLAKMWDRDNTRVEWARWVYHHPEETEKLVEMILQIQDLKLNLEPLTDEEIDRITGVDLNG